MEAASSSGAALAPPASCRSSASKGAAKDGAKQQKQEQGSFVLLDEQLSPTFTSRSSSGPRLVLIARCQENSSDLMRAEARLLGCSHELCSGVFLLPAATQRGGDEDNGEDEQDHHINTVSESAVYAACAKHVLKPLVLARTYDQFLAGLRAALSSRKQHVHVLGRVSNKKPQPFVLVYEQQPRCSELESKPFVPSVVDGSRFSRRVAAVMRKMGWLEAGVDEDEEDDVDEEDEDERCEVVGGKNASSGRVHRTIPVLVVVETAKFVLAGWHVDGAVAVMEGANVDGAAAAASPRAGDRPLSTASTTTSTEPKLMMMPPRLCSVRSLSCALPIAPHSTFLDEYFKIWSRSDKPWSFNSSLCPFIARCTLNLTLCVAFQEAERRRHKVIAGGSAGSGASRTSNSLAASLLVDVQKEIDSLARIERSEWDFSVEATAGKLFLDSLPVPCTSCGPGGDMGLPVEDPADKEVESTSSSRSAHSRSCALLCRAIRHFRAKPLTLVDACTGTGTFVGLAGAQYPGGAVGRGEVVPQENAPARTSKNAPPKESEDTTTSLASTSSALSTNTNSPGSLFRKILACDRSKEFLERAETNLSFAQHFYAPKGCELFLPSSGGGEHDETHDVEIGTKESVNMDAHQQVQQQLFPRTRGEDVLVPPQWSFHPIDWTDHSEDEIMMKRTTPGAASCATTSTLFQHGLTKEDQHIVIANTPWGKRFGSEEDAAPVAKGAIRAHPDALALGILVPPSAVKEVEGLMDVKVKVPYGKPAVLLVGTPKRNRGGGGGELGGG